MLAKRFLQRREIGVVGQPFDGNDLGALGLNRQHEAGTHGRAIDNDRAGAAHAVLAADMGSGEPQMVAQAIRERQPRLNLHFDLSTVDTKSHCHGELLLSSRGRALERALDHRPHERAAVGGAGMNVVLRIDGSGRGCFGLGDGRLIDGASAEHIFG